MQNCMKLPSTPHCNLCALPMLLQQQVFRSITQQSLWQIQWEQKLGAAMSCISCFEHGCHQLFCQEPFNLTCSRYCCVKSRFSSIKMCFAGGSICAVVRLWSSCEWRRRCTAGAMVVSASCGRTTDSNHPQAKSACVHCSYKKRSSGTAPSVSILTKSKS